MIEKRAIADRAIRTTEAIATGGAQNVMVPVSMTRIRLVVVSTAVHARAVSLLNDHQANDWSKGLDTAVSHHKDLPHLPTVSVNLTRPALFRDLKQSPTAITAKTVAIQQVTNLNRAATNVLLEEESQLAGRKRTMRVEQDRAGATILLQSLLRMIVNQDLDIRKQAQMEIMPGIILRSNYS